MEETTTHCSELDRILHHCDLNKKHRTLNTLSECIAYSVNGRAAILLIILSVLMHIIFHTSLLFILLNWS